MSRSRVISRHQILMSGSTYQVVYDQSIQGLSRGDGGAMARKMIDLAGIAELLGVSPTTPPQWRQRSRKGEMDPPLPEPDDPSFPDKPLWYPETIENWARRSDRWPPGTAARPLARKAA